MTDRNKHDSKDIPNPSSPNDVGPALEGELANFGGDPRLTTTIKAWAPGKPPGGKLPSVPAAVKTPSQDKS